MVQTGTVSTACTHALGLLIATCKDAESADVFEPGSKVYVCLRDINQHNSGTCAYSKDIYLRYLCQT